MTENNPWPSSLCASNTSIESPLLHDSWEGERRMHEYGNHDGIVSWIDDYKDVSFETDLYACHTYDQSCYPSPAPPLSTPITHTMIGLDAMPSNFGGFSVGPSATLTTIPNLPTNRALEVDKGKATEFLGDYPKEYTQMNEEGKPPTKRQMSAAAHNLSERRRRDKINVYMKDLQELIPLSIKLDKASLLQRTCEYINSLKMQLQMFSMICNIHQTMGISFPGRFQMPEFYMCPTYPSNIPEMLDYANLHNKSQKLALAQLCKQYLSLYENEFPRGARPKMLGFADPQHQAQMGGLAQSSQQFLSYYI